MGIHGSNDDAGKTAVPMIETAGELDRPLARGPAQHRLADKDLATVPFHMDLKVLPVGQVDWLEGQVAPLQIAVGADHP
jgi:hypothetical protein